MIRRLGELEEGVDYDLESWIGARFYKMVSYRKYSTPIGIVCQSLLRERWSVVESKNCLTSVSIFRTMKLSKTLELVPAGRAISIFGIAEDSSGGDAGSYLQRVETSLRLFVLAIQRRKEVNPLNLNRPMAGKEKAA